MNLENLKEELALEENAEIVETTAADLTGDGTKDKVILLGNEPEVLLKDFTGDEIAEVMVAANSGGSGGVYYHLIATFKGSSV